MPSAPDNAEYLLLSGSAGLTAYRVIQLGNGLLAVDGGALGNWTLSADESQLDHNALAQLTTGNPHTQYIQGAILSADGDILTRVAGVPDNLPIGNNGQQLVVSSGLPAWADPPRAYRLLDSQPTEVVVTNSTTPTTFYTYSIPANTLAAGDLLRLRLGWDYLNSSGSTRFFTIVVSIGGTTIYQDSSPNISSAADRGPWPFWMDFYVRNQNPNIRFASVVNQPNTGAPTTGIGRFQAAGNPKAIAGDANITLSNANTLSVTVTLSNTTATQEMRQRGATLELIKA